MYFNVERHPLMWVRHLLLNYDPYYCKLDFSRYVYEPRVMKDSRFIFPYSAGELNKSFLLGIVENLSPGEELALHSNVSIKGDLFHIPMVDFGNQKYHGFRSDIFSEFYQLWGVDFAVFDSGRSFHAYGDRCLSHDEWIQFMGSLLLLNKPGMPKVIDDRWVGHRLLAGYSALRWSCNSNFYKKTPEYIGMFSDML